MRICCIVPRITGPYGGARHMLHYVSALKKQGHEVIVYTHKIALNSTDLISMEGIQIVESAFPRVKSHNMELALTYLLALGLVARVRGKFDMIHVWGPQGAFIGLLLRIMRRGYSRVPMILLTGAPPRFAYDLKEEVMAGMNIISKTLFRAGLPFIRFMDSTAVRMMDEVIVNNDWVFEQFMQIYGRECAVIYPGVEAGRFETYSKQEARSRLGLDQDLVIYLSVSRLHARKRIDEAVKIFMKHSEGKTDNAFFIIGDGPDKDNLQSLIGKLNADKVQLLGWLSDEEVACYYKAADYFIFTAKNEPFGIAPVEARIAGCQIIPEVKVNPAIPWEESAAQMISICEKVMAQRTG